jgi:hypothetical protein
VRERERETDRQTDRQREGGRVGGRVGGRGGGTESEEGNRERAGETDWLSSDFFVIFPRLFKIIL